MIGKTILHYHLIKKLGEGGMGVVYLAEDLKLERKVAIKFLPRHISANSEEKERFIIEAKAAASFNHPNIATIYSIEDSGDDTFIVMEFIDGIELKDKIKSRPIQKDEAIDIAIQIAEGLDAAHKKGIIHRDIKSSNIMITDRGMVKIMDFGLAKFNGSKSVTKLGSTVGTVSYMSPEQTKGDKIDNRTDIWSFGVVLYEMLTGKMPFRGDYDQAVIYSILNEEPEKVSEIEPQFQHIITKALDKNPDERYQSAKEIIEDLKTIGEGGAVKVSKKNRSKFQWIAAAVVLLLIVAALYLFLPSSKSEKETETVKTLAVLPFLNMSPDPNQEYFSDGLSEELINVLSKNPKLRVTARTSSFSFKGKNVKIKTIANTLNVKNILEGSVRKTGNNLRISANLINAETEASFWSETYDGKLNNIFALQDSISISVAEALKTALLGNKAVVSVQKTDPEAYNFYLLGRHFLNLKGKDNWEKANNYYEKVLSTDSSYAPAWLGLSSIQIALADHGLVGIDEGYNKALQFVNKALELDPDYAEAYSILGWIKRTYNWDWKEADRVYKRGLKAGSANIGVINGAATLECTLGRFDNAINLAHRSIEINPINDAQYNNLGGYALYAGSLDESITAFRKCLELNPKYPFAHTSLGIVYLEKGKPDSALVEVIKEIMPDGKIEGLALVYYALGKKKESDVKLSEAVEKYHEWDAFQIAEIYAFRGENDKAFEWLEIAYNQRDGGLAQIIGDPLLRNIVKDPRYDSFMKKMNLLL